MGVRWISIRKAVLSLQRAETKGNCSVKVYSNGHQRNLSRIKKSNTVKKVKLGENEEHGLFDAIEELILGTATQNA